MTCFMCSCKAQLCVCETVCPQIWSIFTRTLCHYIILCHYKLLHSGSGSLCPKSVEIIKMRYQYYNNFFSVKYWRFLGTVPSFFKSQRLFIEPKRNEIYSVDLKVLLVFLMMPLPSWKRWALWKAVNTLLVVIITLLRRWKEEKKRKVKMSRVKWPYTLHYKFKKRYLAQVLTTVNPMTM